MIKEFEILPFRVPLTFHAQVLFWNIQSLSFQAAQNTVTWISSAADAAPLNDANMSLKGRTKNIYVPTLNQVWKGTMFLSSVVSIVFAHYAHVLVISSPCS